MMNGAFLIDLAHARLALKAKRVMLFSSTTFASHVWLGVAATVMEKTHDP